jgi:hypothetical protein
MDKLTQYRSLVKKHLSEFAAYANRGRPVAVETDCVFDEQRDQYLLMSFGWNQDRRVYITLLHARIQGGKIWIEQDDTEEGMANALVCAGVPREEIVLAFQPPNLRQLTEFACS